MTRRKLGALMFAAGLVACGGCGGGSNNSDNNSNTPNNESNTPNNETNSSNTPNNANNAVAFWSMTITGLEGQDNMPLPADGLGGPKLSKAGAKLLGNNGEGAEPQQTFTIELSSGDEYDSTGEKESGILVTWGDPRIECISNLDDRFNPVGGTLNITETNPITGTFTADVDCYLQSDAGANAVAAQVTGEIKAFASPF